MANINVTGPGWRGTINGDGASEYLGPTADAYIYEANGGDDTIEGGGGGDLIRGGEGSDTAAYVGSREGVDIDLVRGFQYGGDAEGDILESIENVIGSRYADVIRGDNGANRLEGGAGQDTVNGGRGNDTLVGNLDGVTDTLNGGLDNDTVDYSAATRDMTIRLGGDNGVIGTGVVDTSSAIVNIGGRSMTMIMPEIREDYLISIENVTAGSGDDTIVGNSANNVLRGNDGNDTLIGNGGADTFFGGEGSDTFVFSNADLLTAGTDAILDFVRGVDKISLSGIDASLSASGDQAFRFAGSEFTGHTGEVIVSNGPIVAGLNLLSLVSGDINGDGIADFQLSVRSEGLGHLSAGDFIL